MPTLPLSRADRTVYSFLSALGRAKETRLTATLGYLISRFPEEFLPLVCDTTSGDYEVSVEETDEGDRYDVLVKGGKYPTILEGKIGLRQSERQLSRYIDNVREKYKKRPNLVVVDVGSAKSQSFSDEFESIRRNVTSIRYVSWNEIAKVCKRIAQSKRSHQQNRIGAAIAEDFTQHLEETQMSTATKREFYLRDVSTLNTVDLFFRHGIYKCQPQFLKSAQNNLYFAPYFTGRTANRISQDNMVPIGEGISYVARIQDVQVIPKARLLEFLKSKHIPNPQTAAKLVRRKHQESEILILLLGKPRLLFVSPITKQKLSKIKASDGKFTNGAMGSRSCTLEDLLAASQV